MEGRSRIPSYRLHRPSGQAVVTLSGRDVYLGPHGSEVSKAEYDRVVREWLTNNRQLPHRLGGGRTLSVAELMATYWAHVQKHYVKDGKPTGEQAAIKAALRPLLKLYGHVDVSEFGPQSLLACREEMIERGWCRYTVNKHVGRVRRMFAWATEREFVPGSVYHGLLAVKGLQRGRTAAKESPGVSTVKVEHVEAVLPHVSAPVAAMIRLQLAAGMRPGEVVLMRACDIERSETVWVYAPTRHKTEHHGHARTVPLGPEAQRILKPFLEDRDPEAFLFDPRQAEAARSARRRLQRRSKVYGGRARAEARARPPGDRYTRDSYRRAVQRACEQAGVPSWHPHQLRHNAATRLQREVGIEAARVVLGHQSPAVTEIYVERDLGLAKQVMARLG